MQSDAFGNDTLFNMFTWCDFGDKILFVGELGFNRDRRGLLLLLHRSFSSESDSSRMLAVKLSLLFLGDRMWAIIVDSIKQLQMIGRWAMVAA